MSPPPLQGAELQQQQQQLDLRLQQRCGPLPPPRPVADLQPASLRATTTTAGGTPAATPADPPPKAAPGSAALPAAARALIRAHGVASAKGSAADGERSASLLLEIAAQQGPKAKLATLSALLEQIQQSQPSVEASEQLLQAFISQSTLHPCLPTLICQALATSGASPRRLVACGLPAEQQAVVALALLDSRDPELRPEGLALLRDSIQKLQRGGQSSGSPDPPVCARLLFALSEHSTSIPDSGDLAAAVKGLLSACRAQQGLDASEALIVLPIAGRGDPVLTEALAATARTVTGQYHPMAPDSSLAGVVEELGPACTASKASFQEVLRQFRNLDEVAVGHLMAVMCSSPGKSASDPNDLSAVFSGAIRRWNREGDTGDGKVFNVEAAVDALKEASPSLDWRVVAEHLDCDKFLLRSAQGFLHLVDGIKRGLGSEDFPLSAVLSVLWANPAGQLSFLAHAVTSPPEVLTFDKHGRCASPLEGLHAGKSAVGTNNSAWLSLELLETLGRLAECAGLQSNVHAVLDHPMKHCPEVLLAGLAACRPEVGQLRTDICSVLLPGYVASHPNSVVVLQRVWPLHREGILVAMADLYAKDPTAMSRILDVCQELKALTEVLGSMPFPFALELAALAARREYLNLDKWLQDRLASFGLPFLMACLEFLDDKTKRGAAGLQEQQDGQPTSGGQIQLSPEVQGLFFQFLTSNAVAMPHDAQDALKHIQVQSQAVGGKDGGVTSPPPAAHEVFASDIEEEANSHFQKIYTSQTSIDEVVGMLKHFKTSSITREQEIFACMIHNLFDEYRFFPKYPDKELHITAVLFGALVHHQLVSFASLGIALRYVLDALRKPLGSKMFTFGLEALNQFRGSLREWPQYCKHVLSVPHLQQAQPELCAFIERLLVEASAKGAAMDGRLIEPQTSIKGDAIAGDVGANKGQGNKRDDAVEAGADATKGSMDGRHLVSFVGATDELLADLPASKSPAPPTVDMPTEPTVTTAAVVSSPATNAAIPTISHLSGALAGGMGAAPSFASTINAETLEQAAEQWNDFPQPEEAVQDRIHFLINNVSANNIMQKSADVQSVISEEFYPWFANYMVVKRAAQEANFHALYLELMEKMGDNKLANLLVRTTYHYVKILILSERIKTDSGERSLLKNLGSFLGQLTIAKDRPVLHRDLDMKKIIMDAYQHGKMIAAIPFVHKVLEACKVSRVFKPPNPWLMGITSLLAEIYALDKLKLNLKFEIEMLFKDLNLQIPEVLPSHLLAGLEREMGPSNPDFTVDKPGIITQEKAATVSVMASEVISEVVAPVPSKLILAGEQGGLMAGSGPGDQQMHLNAYVVINPNLQVVAERLQLKRVVPVAVDRAICEIITPVVERSVTIACMTTQELILKDFATEPDEARMRTAAHQMVSSLAGSLTLVTCKEPLRVSLSNQLRQLLAPNCPEQSILEQTMTIIAQDNLDLGCTIIEKAATDKAVRDIDERLMPVYQMRQKAKATGQPFYDQNMESRIPSTLPDALRPKPGHLNSQQQRVYDDFLRIPRASSLPPGMGTRGSAMGGYDGEQTSTAAVLGVSTQKPDDAVATSSLADKYAAWQARLDAFTMKDPGGLFGAQPEGSEGRNLMAELADMCRKTAGREELSLALGQRLFRALVAGQQTRMHITAYVTALEVLREAAAFRQLPLHITQWFTSTLGTMEDDRRWSRAAAEALIRARLLHLPDFDAYLAKALSAVPLGPASEMALHLIRACILAPEPVATAGELYSTLDILGKIASRSSNGGALIALVEQARQVGSGRVSRLPVSASVGPKPSGMGLKADKGDPLGLREQVAALFDEWARLLDATVNDRLHSSFVAQLQQQGLLKGDELTDRFLRILTELAVAHCISSEGTSGMAALGRPGALSFVAIDALVRLLTCLIQAHGLGATLLAKALVVICGVLQGDADERGGAFNSRPYYRLMLGLICELSPSDTSDVQGMSYLMAISAALHSVQPLRVPGFSFSWLDLISHRQLMPKLLQSVIPKGRTHFQRLLTALLRFLEPYLRNAQLIDSVRLLYRGTLRVLLVLLHDFPEFLCENHFTLCDAIPPSCIQMRNLILSAFPRNMRLPDPFTPNLKVDLLPEISQPPRIIPDPEHLLPKQLQAELDIYLSTRQPISFLADLRPRLLLPVGEQAVLGTRYNAPLINALVLYVGVQAIAAKGGQGSSPAMHTPAMEVFQRLAAELDTEGRYLFLNAIANQLRYPNNHTHYFSCVLLYLFAEAQMEIIQEQVTRVLLERLIVNRPHPWGLLITFIELIKNPRYSFWSHSFTRCAQEIEKLFESVARSCMGAPPKPEDDLHLKSQDAAARG